MPIAGRLYGGAITFAESAQHFALNTTDAEVETVNLREHESSTRAARAFLFFIPALLCFGQGRGP